MLFSFLAALITTLVLYGVLYLMAAWRIASWSESIQEDSNKNINFMKAFEFQIPIWFHLTPYDFRTMLVSLEDCLDDYMGDKFSMKAKIVKYGTLKYTLELAIVPVSNSTIEAS